jgi:WD40 repeat protein
MAFCPDGKELVTVAKGGLVQFWDYRRIEETRRQRLSSSEMEIESVVYHPQGKRLAVAFGNSLFLCDLPFVFALTELKGHSGPVRSVAWLSGGELIASGSDDGSIRIWNAETGEMLLKLDSRQGHIHRVVASPAGDLLASNGEDSSIRLWSASPELPVVEVEPHQEAVNCIALSDDGERLASGGEDKTIRVWDTHTGDLLETLHADHPVMEVRFQNGTPEDWTNPAELQDPEVKKEATTERRNHIIKSADGRVSAQFTSQMLRAFRQPSEQELAYRRWMTRPDPYWHAEQQAKFTKEGNLHAAQFHRVTEERAKAVIALDQGNPELAYWHFVAAAILKARGQTK